MMQVYDKKASNVYGWLKWIIEAGLTLNFPEGAWTRKYTSLDTITNKTVKKYMFKVMNQVEKEISEIVKLVPSYSLMFDGWTENSYHFIGLFLCCNSKTDDLSP